MKDGGPAFPVQKYEGSWIDGMTLRDYFAAKAMPSLIPDMRSVMGFGPYQVAQRAYEIADAMLKARG